MQFPASDRKALSGGCVDIGVTVHLHGLVARPELNGMRGTILEWRAESGRYLVELPDGKTIGARAANLKRARAGGSSFAARTSERAETTRVDSDGTNKIATFDPRELEIWVPSAKAVREALRDGSTRDTPLCAAFDNAMPLGSKMAMMQIKSVPTRSIETSLAAPSQWLWTLFHLIAGFEQGHHAFMICTGEGPRGDAAHSFADASAALGIVVAGKVGARLVLAAPEGGVAGAVEAGAPLLPAMVLRDTAKNVWRTLQGATRPLNVMCVTAESAAQIAYGTAELLEQRAKRVAPSFEREVRARLPFARRDRWQASFLAPPTDVSVPAPPKQSEICAHCSVERRGSTKFAACSGCRGALYCSKRCQRADWPTHRKVCGRLADDDDARASVVVSTITPKEVQGQVLALASFTGEDVPGGAYEHITDQPPDNIHGNSIFIVKVQVPPRAHRSNRAMIYDRTRSFQLAFVNLPSDAADFIRAEKVTQGLKAYLFARREGANLRLFLDERAPLQAW